MHPIVPIMYIDATSEGAKDPHGSIARSLAALGMLTMYTSHGSIARSLAALGMLTMYTSHGSIARSLAALV